MTAGWLAAACAEDAAPANRGADLQQQPPRLRIAPLANLPAPAADARAAGEAPRRPAPADNTWQWSFESQRPALEYRLTEGTSVRLHGSRNGTAVYLNWRF